MTVSAEPQSSEQSWAGSADEWCDRIFDATLDSGMRVSFRLVSLVEMAQLGELPVELRELAWLEWAEKGALAKLAVAPLNKLTAKSTKKQRAAAEKESGRVFEQITALNRHLIAASLVAPKMTVEQLAVVPLRDLERLSVLCNRGSGVDATGRYVGVVPLDQFRVALAAHGHDPCPPDCPSCTEARWALSQVRR